MFFCPEKGNVAFSSALDCWAFNLTMFARRLAQKLGMNSRVLQKFLWGEYYFFDKKVTRKPRNDKHKPMFVQLVLEPLIQEYRKQLDPVDMSSQTELRVAREKIKA